MYDKNNNYRFLPKSIRSFDNQKKLFKAIYKNVNYENKNNEIDSFYKIGWTQMAVNVVDIFLYNMALRGYTLQSDNRFKKFKLFEDEPTIDSTANKFHQKDMETGCAKRAYELIKHIIPQNSLEKLYKKQLQSVVIDMFESIDARDIKIMKLEKEIENLKK